MGRRLLISIGILIFACSFCLETKQKTEAFVTGIDHIPIVVKNLDSAAYLYKALGFSLKPGRPHQNGIINQHVKFPNGTELELITAPEAKDPLTTEYLNHLSEGEGPLYFGLFAANIDAVAGQLDAAHCSYERGQGLIDFPIGHPCHPLFFGSRNRSPTDKPEHFAHKNTALALIKVWLAPDDVTAYKVLFQNIGVTIGQQKISLSSSQMQAHVARLKEGEIIFLPRSFQCVPGHIVVGATVQVKDIRTTKFVLNQSGFKNVTIIKENDGSQRLVLPSHITHGLWLEFVQIP